jgi:lysophospholipase L1-like esterase
MRVSIWAAALCALALLGYNAAVIARTLARSSAVTAQSAAFTAEPDRVLQRLLVLGDSTGVGTGSASPGDSVAGRIAGDFPDTRIENLSRNGARSEDLPSQLAQTRTASFDLILIQIGGNDALRFTPREQLRRDIDQSLQIAREKSDRIILMTIGDLGKAPALPWPLSQIFSWRAGVVRDVLREAARRQDVHYLDLLPPADQESPFLQDPARYYSRDYLHPSGDGYGVWYRQLLSETPLAAWLEQARQS